MLRRLFLKEIEALFLHVVLLAGKAKVLQLCTMVLDGATAYANSGSHCALSYDDVRQLDAHLSGAVWPRGGPGRGTGGGRIGST